MAIITPTYAGDKSLNSKFVDYTQTNTNAVEKIIGIIENNMITYLDDCLSIYKNEGGDIVRPDKLKMVAAHLTEQAYLHNVSDVDGNQDKVKKMTHDDYSEEFFSPSELSRSGASQSRYKFYGIPIDEMYRETLNEFLCTGEEVMMGFFEAPIYPTYRCR